MANPFSKGWNYLMALFDNKIEEKADPKVQIQQAIEQSQKQHRDLSQQAAAVIGNQRQLEMQLNRQLNEIEKLQGNTRQALKLADQARAQGDNAKAVEYENAAEAFATQLVSAEQGVEDTKKLHDQALQQAQAAKQAVERSAMNLQQQTAEKTKLLSQLEQAKMQEKVAESINSMNSISAQNSPNLEQVRDKIENRYAKALGSAELAENSVDYRMAEIQQANTQFAGHSRLEQIRAEMNTGNQAVTGGQATPELTQAPTSSEDDAVAQKLRELREQ
ncbi:MAG: PspA/IM30 family protein [Corynebacterium sp.]|nr:PspA/IM30 family protein [Corynebacterium sp.]